MNTAKMIKAIISGDTATQQELLNSADKPLIEADKKSMMEALDKALASMQKTFYDPAQTSITQASITSQSMIPTPQELSHEERQELSDLEHQHAFETKKSKLDYFKALPKEFRQQIVNRLLWEDAVQEIDAIYPVEPDRLSELKIKSQIAGQYVNPFFGMHRGLAAPSTDAMGYPWYPNGNGTQTLLPRGISRADILQAHLDASLEEEIHEG